MFPLACTAHYTALEQVSGASRWQSRVHMAHVHATTAHCDIFITFHLFVFSGWQHEHQHCVTYFQTDFISTQDNSYNKLAPVCSNSLSNTALARTSTRWPSRAMECKRTSRTTAVEVGMTCDCKKIESSVMYKERCSNLQEFWHAKGPLSS